jgi:hypothetical protein
VATFRYIIIDRGEKISCIFVRKSVGVIQRTPQEVMKGCAESKILTVNNYFLSQNCNIPQIVLISKFMSDINTRMQPERMIENNINITIK